MKTYQDNVEINVSSSIQCGINVILSTGFKVNVNISKQCKLTCNFRRPCFLLVALAGKNRFKFILTTTDSLKD